MNNTPGHNANNNLHANGVRSTTSYVPISTVVWRVMTQVVEMVFRMYLTVLVVIYQWSVQIISRLLSPLQPALDQVRKVPRQDISLKGIFYQYVRLVFILVVYFTPWLARAGAQILKPLRRFRDWAIDYVEGPLDGAAAGGGKQQARRDG